ncbi:SulP family inorganic anion transporter [Hespellia stercorisuis]|uniref:Sulfate permease, SulP family n=1 Tax=Hespellia stercorisuis DSM 15480 TaxID=1121950 RepID=A0A1M6NIH7_9FIRM|nr:sulfate permease [Hespellia stercorisuis]SHJ95446.1 sulfate permease, SulP family [Hespellia stercorisuis DSM 15480]
MNNYAPKLLSIWNDYSKEQFIKDIVAGIIVAIIALPLSIALALASGVSPEQGIYTAIFAGFVIAALGGSRVQISGPTAAFATIVAGIVATKGIAGLAVATILAGIFLIVMGLCKFGSLIKYIPYTIVTGFTSGIAVTIFIGQIKDFLGLTFEKSPIETLEKLEQCVATIGTINYTALIVGVLSLAILILWPKVNAKIPPSLIAVIAAIILVKVLHLDVNTIGSLYEISNKLPVPSIPHFDFALVRSVLPDAMTIAILAAIESLLSCVVSDGMIGDEHNPNAELIGQGAGNIVSAIFGGIPATGAIARTAANVKNGGRSPISGMVHSIVLVLILILLMPYAALIPMPTIAAILFMVAYNMCGWKEFLHLLKKAPKSDILVLVTTFVLTVVFDLVVAIEVGFVLAAFLFLKRMSDVAEVRGWTYSTNPEDNLETVPKGTLVYEVIGPMFFAAADKFLNVYKDKGTKVVILRMRSVPAMDMSALRKLEEVHTACQKANVTLIISHAAEQPLKMMEKGGFVEKVGPENFRANIHEALAYAATLCAKTTSKN